MKNEFEISNLNEIYKGDFDQMVEIQGLETFSKAAVDAFYNQFGDILQKSEENELSSEDKDQMELIKAEVNSLKMWEVLDDKFNKSVVFTRPSQIDIEKGIYKDTALNRKMGRVGQKWGGKKEEEKDRGKGDENDKMSSDYEIKYNNPKTTGHKANIVEARHKVTGEIFTHYEDKGKEGHEYYTGENYGGQGKSYSRNYEHGKYPEKHKEIYSHLEKLHKQYYKKDK